MFKKIGFIGAGTVGGGIVEMLASSGLDVYLVEKNEERLQAVITKIKASLDRQKAKWALTESEKKIILNRIHTGVSMQAFTQCELVIEAIEENLAQKKELFAQLDKIVSPNTVLATNMATISISELANASAHPARVIGLHFVFPVLPHDVVEIVRGSQTSKETFGQVKKFIEQDLKKYSVTVKDSSGLVTTRLSCLMINEALKIVEEEVTTIEEVDEAMKQGYKFKVGPLEIADRLGIDSVVLCLKEMYTRHKEEKYRPCDLLLAKVQSGEFGVKTGTGFFKYDEDGARVK